MDKILLCTLLIFLNISAKAQLEKAVVSGIKNKYLNIPYATISEAQKLDIYLPDDGDGPFPVIICIHGGGFEIGDKRDRMLEPMLHGLKRGYAVVSINYRLSGEAVWPAQIHDCKAAIRWLRANADTYKFNPDKIAAWGGSAGGHLSAMLGTTGGISHLEDLSMGNPEQSSRIQAVVNWFGPTSFLKMDDQLKESAVENPMKHSIPSSPESNLLGKNIVHVPELVKEADPTTWVSSDDAPFFIQHGTEDNLVPYQGSVILARKLGKAIGYDNVYMELFPDTGHGNGPAFYNKANMDNIFSFLDAHLKEKEKGSIEIDGFKLDYSVEGEGIPCLVIGSSVYYPRTFSDNLRKHLKMYFVDLRWFGRNDGTVDRQNMTIQSISQDIEQIRSALKLDTFIIMGHSIHGTIAMEYARQYPKHVSHCVLIGSPNIYNNEEYDKGTEEIWKTASQKRQELQNQNWEKIKEMGILSGAEQVVENYIAMAPKYWFNPRYDARWLWKDMTIDADIINYLYGTVYRDYNMFQKTPTVPVPTFVALGKYDYVIPLPLWKNQSNINNLTIHVFEKSGHTAQLEEPELFDKAIQNWLKISAN
ncbi:MAG: alpha/beta hydrolase [Bacteroidales bacterium]|nr:alpha/beta hydrolase [Bacteroidales bacterium]